MARLTGLEPATPGVTGRYSNQLSYNRPLPVRSERWGVLWPRPGIVKRRFQVFCPILIFSRTHPLNRRRVLREKR